MKNFFSIKSSLFVFSTVLILSACSNSTEKADDTKNTSSPEVKIKAHVNPPDFNADSAYVFVKTQADMGPRTPGSKAHEACAKFMQQKLSAYGAELIVQKGTATTYDQKKWGMKNIIASFNSEVRSRVLLCAHWDSRPFCDRDSIESNKKKPCPGVNDGASGVGVLLEVARQLAQKKCAIGIDIIMFDLEDYGQNDNSFPYMENSWCLGSQYWAQNPHQPGYFAKYGVLLDMVGAKNATFPREGQSVFFASSIVDKVWRTASNLNYAQYFVDETKGETTDDHVYINKLANIPCIDILGFDIQRNDFFAHHHRASDTMDNIDKAILKAVGQTLLEVIYNEEE